MSDSRKVRINIRPDAYGRPDGVGARRTLPAPNPDALRHRDDARDAEERHEEDVVDAMERRRRRG